MPASPELTGLPAPCGDEDRDRQVLLHRDLHPGNVILTPAGPMIIDWEGAARGPGTFDVAMTRVILASSEVPETGLAAGVVRAVQGQYTRSFVRAAGPISQSWRATAIRHRLLDPNVLPTERARLERFPH